MVSLVVLNVLLFSFNLALSENSAPSGYTCKINNECLNYLHNSLLNKESEESIYQVCKVSYQNNRDCCINPSQCRESYGENMAQSLSITQQVGTDPLFCQLGNLSDLIYSLSSVRNSVCSRGVENCKSFCESKLEDFKQTFKECFFIQNHHTIDSILEKAQNPSGNQNCYQEIKDIAEKYRKQSLNEQSLFKEELEVKDIVNCENIKKEANQKNLNSLALNVCHQVQAQRQHREKREQEFGESMRLQEAERQITQEEQRWETFGINEWDKQQEFILQDIAASYGGNRTKDQQTKFSLKQRNRRAPQSKEQAVADNKTLLGAGAMAGAVAGVASSKFSANSVSKTKTTDKSYREQTMGIYSAKRLNSFDDQLLYKSGKGQITKQPAKQEKLSLQAGPENMGTFEQSQKTTSNSFFRRNFEKVKSSLGQMFITAKEKFSAFRRNSQRGLFSFISARANESCDPQITYQMVYQSVEAPQIEVLAEQEFQKDPDNPVFKSYDLVKGKSAGVVIEIQYPDSCPTYNRDFNLKMQIDNKFIQSRCLSFTKTKHSYLQFQNSTPSEASCLFSIGDLSANDNMIFRFVEIPTDLVEIHKIIPVKINIFEGESLIPNFVRIPFDGENEKTRNCGQFINLEYANEFCLNVLAVKSFSIGAIALKGSCPDKQNPNNNKDLSTSSNAITAFMNSNEVQDYLPYIFPIPERNAIVLIQPLKGIHIMHLEELIAKEPLLQFNRVSSIMDDLLLKPSCNSEIYYFKERDRYAYSHGIMETIKTLYDVLVENLPNKDRIVVLISRDFMDYHNVPKTGTRNPVGFIIAHEGEVKYRRIMFIHERYIDQGVLLHEIAHTLGQDRDFYEPANKCKKFNDDSEGVFCENQYFIQRGLIGRLNGNYFQWITETDLKSIMDRTADIEKRWIDRETYQKAFNYQVIFRKYAESVRENNAEEANNIVVLSGIYDKMANQVTSLNALRLRGGKISPPYLIHEFMEQYIGFDGEQQLNYIKIQIIQNNGVIHTAKQPVDMYIETYFDNGESESTPLDETLIHASLPIENQEQFRAKIFKGVLQFDKEGRLIGKTESGSPIYDGVFK